MYIQQKWQENALQKGSVLEKIPAIHTTESLHETWQFTMMGLSYILPKSSLHNNFKQYLWS